MVFTYSCLWASETCGCQRLSLGLTTQGASVVVMGRNVAGEWETIPEALRRAVALCRQGCEADRLGELG